MRTMIPTLAAFLPQTVYTISLFKRDPAGTATTTTTTTSDKPPKNPTTPTTTSTSSKNTTTGLGTTPLNNRAGVSSSECLQLINKFRAQQGRAALRYGTSKEACVNVQVKLLLANGSRILTSTTFKKSNSMLIFIFFARKTDFSTVEICMDHESFQRSKKKNSRGNNRPENQSSARKTNVPLRTPI